MFCSKCGNQLEEGAVFCSKCGSKVGDSTPAEATPNVVVKTKKDCVYAALCNYMRATVLITGINPSFGELEEYEEGQSGKIYCELVASTRNALGQTKRTRYGAVIKEVEADGNVVFFGPGPQLVTPLTGTKMLKKVLGFRSK